MTWWRDWHRRPAWTRTPLKLGFLLIVIVLTLYPRLDLVPTWIGRIRNLSSVVDASNPKLAPLEADVRAKLRGSESPRAVLDCVESVVYQYVPYAWDWDTWGVVDYLPTVDEVFQKGREDCDGRAVVAASLLRRLGHKAELVSDVLHVWVDTPEGSTMAPTSTEKTLVSTPTGTKITITPGLIRNLGRGISYGVGAFPFAREIIILAALAAVALQPRSSFWRRVAGCLLLWIALLLVREVGMKAAREITVMESAQVWFGWGLAIVGLLVLAIRAGGAARHSAEAPPG